MNPFFWIFALMIPVLVFAAKPDSSAKFRIWRLIGAILLGYTALNAMIYSYYYSGWHSYQICQSQFPDGSLQQHTECGKPPKGLGLMFYPLIGWVFAAGYAGFWELCWRWKYRSTIAALKSYSGKAFSTILIVCAIPVWIYMFFGASLVVYMLTTCPPNVAKSKCWFPDHD